MPLYSADALILRTYKLGEADRIVVFLTRERGKKRGGAQGARRLRANFVGGLEPLTVARGGVAGVAARAAGTAAAPLARYFEYWLLRLQGVYPAHLVCRQCGGALGE